MDGRGRALDNVFVERLWRTVRYEEVYLKDYGTPREAIQGLARFFQGYVRDTCSWSADHEHVYGKYRIMVSEGANVYAGGMA